MAIAEKYEWLSASDSNPARAVHRRLRREVVIHAVDLRSLDDDQKAAIRSTGSHLASLDHPALPHLIDFIEDGDSYYLVVESFEQPLSLDTLSLLDVLRQLEQVCDALVHARTRGIEHGNLSASDLRVDQQGHIKLAGLGLQQLSPVVERDLAQADLRQILQWIEQAIERNEQAIDHDADGHTSSETLRSIADLRSLLAIAEHNECRSVSDFHPFFRRWLDKELARREAKKLLFTAETEEQEVASTAVKPMLIAAGVISLLIVGLLAAIFWPRPENLADLRNKPDAESRVVNVTAQADAAAKENPTAQQHNAPRKGGFVSELGNVGVLNTQAETGTPIPPAEEASSVPDSPSELKNSPSPNPDNGNKDALSEKTDTKADEVKKPATPVSKPIKEPFADVPGAVSLPTIADSRMSPLVITKLTGDTSIDLELVGGVGAYKSGEFKLTQNGPNSWIVDYIQDESVQVAQLEFNEGKLAFGWATSQELSAIAPHLGNAALLLAYGESRHTLALRDYDYRPAIPVDLERRKPYDIDLLQPPDPKDVIIEFVPMDGSLAKALPSSVIEANGKMRIGLDAGKKSLVVVSVQPKFKTRTQTLSIRASARLDQRSRFVPVKSGAAAKLRSDLATIAQTLFQLKAAKKQAKGKAEDRIELQIKSLEQNKSLIETFAESYSAAAKTKLQFRIYRQIGPHRIPLVAYGLKL